MSDGLGNVLRRILTCRREAAFARHYDTVCCEAEGEAFGASGNDVREALGLASAYLAAIDDWKGLLALGDTRRGGWSR